MTILGLGAVAILAGGGLIILVAMILMAITSRTSRLLAQLKPSMRAETEVVDSAAPHCSKIMALTAHSVEAVRSPYPHIVPGLATRRPGLSPRWKDPHRVHAG